MTYFADEGYPSFIIKKLLSPNGEYYNEIEDPENPSSSIPVRIQTISKRCKNLICDDEKNSNISNPSEKKEDLLCLKYYFKKYPDDFSTLKSLYCLKILTNLDLKDPLCPKLLGFYQTNTKFTFIYAPDEYKLKLSDLIIQTPTLMFLRHLKINFEILCHLVEKLKIIHEHCIVLHNINDQNVMMELLLSSEKKAESISFYFTDFSRAEIFSKNKDMLSSNMEFDDYHFASPEKISGNLNQKTIPYNAVLADLWSISIWIYVLRFKKFPLFTLNYEYIEELFCQDPSQTTPELLIWHNFFSKSFQKDPNKRFQSSDEMLTYLTTLGVYKNKQALL